MTIVVGYLPTPEGSAAVDHAMEEAKLTSSRVVVVNTGHYGDFSHPNYATAEDIDALDAQLTTAGIDHEIHRSLESTSAAEAILQAATDSLRRPHRHRGPAPFAGRQAVRRQYRPARPAGRGLPRARGQTPLGEHARHREAETVGA